MSVKTAPTNSNNASIQPRPPVVTILGHVDHGKTSLLDTIRKTKVADREAGGITQSIGASVVATSGGLDITFIDTPGHAAFTKMRSRGAQVADIVILVVAADDGPMPQTLESIKILETSKTPFVVALTKVDLPQANTQATLGALEKHGLLFEGRGGNITYIEPSTKTGKGIDELLEIISLLAQLNGISGDPEAPLKAVVIESTKAKNSSLVSVIVKQGTLSLG